MYTSYQWQGYYHQLLASDELKLHIVHPSPVSESVVEFINAHLDVLDLCIRYVAIFQTRWFKLSFEMTFVSFFFPIIVCYVWSGLYIVLRKASELESRLQGYLERAFEWNENTEVYWLPKGATKAQLPGSWSSSHSLVGIPAKSKPLFQLETIKMKSWDYGPSLLG